YETLDTSPNWPRSCCAADRLGLDPHPKLWRYLLHNLDSFDAWTAVSHRVDVPRMPEFVALIEAALLPRVPMLERGSEVSDHCAVDYSGNLSDDDVPEEELSLALWVILRKVEVPSDLYPFCVNVIERATHAARLGTRTY